MSSSISPNDRAKIGNNFELSKFSSNECRKKFTFSVLYAYATRKIHSGTDPLCKDIPTILSKFFD